MKSTLGISVILEVMFLCFISCFSGLKILKNFKKKVHIKISKLKKDFKSEINPDPKDLHREPITTTQLKKVNHLRI